MKRIIHILLLSCLKATELIEKKMHFKLSFIERLQLKAHKMVCKACANYEKQSELLETGISRLQEQQITQDDIAELKESIYQKLDNLK
ncbi:hypothetical protein ACT29H_11460 [Thermophagus sp. OGC60D27]|uniref:hypothetical protein n=1 Tax=Thermophagus sp. OGC60D27 TaxID=3458415 RepID=UPI004037EE74